MEISAVDVGILVASVATAGFTGWAIWQRWRYTPRPLWMAPVIADAHHYSIRREAGMETEATVSWATENRGDAAAHDVRVFVSDGGSFVERERAGKAFVDPGEAVRASVSMPVTDRGSYDGSRDAYERPLIYTWKPHRVKVTWRQHPNLNRVKSRVWDLPRPKDEP